MQLSKTSLHFALPPAKHRSNNVDGHKDVHGVVIPDPEDHIDQCRHERDMQRLDQRSHRRRQGECKHDHVSCGVPGPHTVVAILGCNEGLVEDLLCVEALHLRRWDIRSEYSGQPGAEHRNRNLHVRDDQLRNHQQLAVHHLLALLQSFRRKLSQHRLLPLRPQNRYILHQFDRVEQVK